MGTTRSVSRSGTVALLTLAVAGCSLIREVARDPATSTSAPPASSTTAPPALVLDLSTTEMVNGQDVAFSGSGCVDPPAGGDEGLRVEVWLNDPAYQSGTAVDHLGAEGAFAGSFVVTDQVPPIATSVHGQCVRDRPGWTDEVVAETDVAVRVRSPHTIEVSPPSAAPGESITVTGLCAGVTDPHWYTGYQVLLVPEGAQPLRQHLAGAPCNGTGAEVVVDVPAGTTPGRYVLFAKIQTQRDTQADWWYEPVSLTVTG